MINLSYYQCPLSKKSITSWNEAGLFVDNELKFPFIEGTQIPVFESAKQGADQYNDPKSVQIYQNYINWIEKTYASPYENLLSPAIQALRLKKGSRVLVVGVGYGAELLGIQKKIGVNGQIYAQDFSKSMIKAANSIVRKENPILEKMVNLSVSDATNLPFKNDCFDAVFHFGGINQFNNVKKSISEMERVVKKKGRVVFGDEGVAPWLTNTEFGEMMMTNNPLFGMKPPLDQLPVFASDVELKWIFSDTFYLISFTAFKQQTTVNMDIEHDGIRGGSIRTRYYGKLEAINPNLRDQLYKEAQLSGISRVKLMENIIGQYFKNKV